MPTVELIAEIELLKARAERAEHMAELWKGCARKLYYCEGITKLLRVNEGLTEELERAEHMARLWKRCAKSMKWRADCAMENDQDGWNQFKLICAKMDNKESELAALKNELELSNTDSRMYCGRTLKAEEREERAREELAALKKDALICALGLQHVDENYNVCVPHEAAMAAERILEATKEG